MKEPGSPKWIQMLYLPGILRDLLSSHGEKTQFFPHFPEKLAAPKPQLQPLRFVSVRSRCLVHAGAGAFALQQFQLPGQAWRWRNKKPQWCSVKVFSYKKNWLVASCIFYILFYVYSFCIIYIPLYQFTCWTNQFWCIAFSESFGPGATNRPRERPLSALTAGSGHWPNRPRQFQQIIVLPICH